MKQPVHVTVQMATVGISVKVSVHIASDLNICYSRSVCS